MKRKLGVLTFMTLLTIATNGQMRIASSGQRGGPGSWYSLLNGRNLSAWKLSTGKANDIISEDSIFNVFELNGEKVLHIKGNQLINLISKRVYENYHVHMQFKWGSKLDSILKFGLSYHSSGLIDTICAHKFVLDFGHLGDIYCLGNASFETPAIYEPDENNYVFSPSGELTLIGNGRTVRTIIKNRDYEKSKGEWNTIDIYCFKRTSMHAVNGECVMVNYNSGENKNGKIIPLTKGKIHLNINNTEVFIKDIKVRDLIDLNLDYRYKKKTE